MSSDDEPGEISRGSRHSRHHHKHSGASSSASGHNYKELYKDVKYELKRKKRDIEELDEQLQKQTKETKKAKQDTQDLWKIYYTLQQELQQAYERNAKLQAEKAAVETELETEKKEFKKLQESQDPTTLKDALCNMQKEKRELQQKFNDIVLENKTLKEKTLTYEPRLREMDDLKQKLHEGHKNAHDIEQAISNLRRDLNVVGVNKEEVEKYRRWNSLLVMESQQNCCKLKRLEMFENVKTRLETENKLLSTKVEAQHKEIRSLTAVRKEKNTQLRFRLEIIRAELRQLKMDWCWNGDAVKNDFRKVSDQINSAVNLIQKLPAAVKSTECKKCAASPVCKSEGSLMTTSLEEKAADPVGVVEALKTGMEQRSEAASELRKKIQFMKKQLMDWEHDLDNYTSDIVEVSSGNGSEDKEFTISRDDTDA